MADTVNQSTLKQVLLPAGAAALIVILIGVLVMQSSFAPKPPGAPGKSGGTGVSATASDPSAEGMVADLPAADAPEWQPLTDGIKVWDVKVGEGDAACPPGATVTIHYTGWNLKGEKFDSSLDTGRPAEFPLANLIQGWQKGIPGMKPGGVRRLYIPYQLAYGERGQGAKIPPKADLVFEVKLIGFQG